MSYDTKASKTKLKEVAQALEQNGMTAHVVQTMEEAKASVLKLIPKKSEVMTMSSVTLDTSGISEVIDRGGDYESMKTKLYAMDSATQGIEMRKYAAAPDFVVGSANALTEKGELVFASWTGSQLPSYAFTAGKVILVVGAQKIVKDIDDAMKRIYDYVLPLESKRANAVYGVPGSAVNKVLQIKGESNPGRIEVILVAESAGY